MEGAGNAAAVLQRFSETGSAPRWADIYDTPTKVLADASFRARRDATVDYLQRTVPAGGRVLDLGCGTAPVLAELRKRGLACAGVDLAPDMLERGRMRLRSMGLDDGDLELGDCRKTPFQDASFDAVACLGVVSYVEAYGEILDEIWRVLKPGGHVLVSFRNRHNLRLWDPWELAKALANGLLLGTKPEPYVIGRFMDFREVCAEMSVRGFEYQSHLGIGYGPLRFRGRALLPEPASLTLSGWLAAAFDKTAWEWPGNWLADVSLWAYRKPG